VNRASRFGRPGGRRVSERRLCGYRLGIAGELPPPDPYETFGTPPDEDRLMLCPAAVFLNGPPSPEADRISDAILALRPGALIVVDGG
jgi:hypothetical protein